MPSGRNIIGKALEPRFNLVPILFESNLEPESSGEICSQQQGFFLWRSFDLDILGGEGGGWAEEGGLTKAIRKSLIVWFAEMNPGLRV